MTTWKKELAKSGAWVLSISHTIKALAFISTIVLARLLTPADFGIVAIATAVVTLVEMLGDFGFHVYLVQKKELNREDLDTAWTFQILLALLESILLLACASLVGGWYKEPRLKAVFYVLAATVLLGGFRNVGIVSFQKELKFHLEFLLRVPSKIIGITAALGLAYALNNYWALILGICSQRITEVAASYTLCSYRPRFCLQGARELFGFSKWLYCNTTLSFVLQRAPDLILGKLAGKDAVGLFSVSHSIATLPTSELAEPVARATFPSYVKLRDDPELLKEGYLKVLRLLAFFAVPMGVGIAALAEIVVPVLLGNKWISAVPVLQILALGGILKTLQSNTGSVFLAVGRPWVITSLWALRVCVLIPMLVVFCLRSGVVGAAWAFFLAEAVTSPFILVYVLRSLRVSWKDVIDTFIRPLLGSLIMYFLLVLVRGSKIILAMPVNILSLGVMVFIGSIIYLSCILLLWMLSGKKDSSPESWILGMARSLFYNHIKLSGNQ